MNVIPLLCQNIAIISFYAKGQAQSFVDGIELVYFYYTNWHFVVGLKIGIYISFIDTPDEKKASFMVASCVPTCSDKLLLMLPYIH